ncbi:MAG: NADH-quinone oxidoreductase subunit NuoG [Alphaproteobacteria bacterium]
MSCNAFDIRIDGQVIPCVEGQTILQAALKAGVVIPHLCYHPGLPPQNACHTCFVTVEGQSGLLTSCTEKVTPGLSLVTKTADIEEARQDVLGLLMATHPAECAVCTQAGACDLQDAAFLYGPKKAMGISGITRSVSTSLNSNVQGRMSRCIGCQKCIAFLDHVAGTGELGLFQDADGFKVKPAFPQGVQSELSGNLIDICPSGALIGAPGYGLERPWEIKTTLSIDVMDAMGSTIQLGHHQGHVVRILPQINEQVNQYWITDKIRFSVDGLKSQRLDQPYVRTAEGLKPVSWIEAFKLLVRKISILEPHEIAFLVGDLMEVDSVYLLRQLLDDLKVPHRDCRVEGAFLPTHSRSDYLFNTGFKNLDRSDACLVIGSDIRRDAPLLNVRIRTRYAQMADRFAVIGQPQDLLFKYTYLGNNASLLNDIASGSHPFARVLEDSHFPMIIVGTDALAGPEGEKVYNTARFIAEKYKMRRDDWDGFNILHQAAGRVGALHAGFTPRPEGQGMGGILRMAKAGHLKLLYLMGVDNLALQNMEETFIVYQGHHWDQGAEKAHLILPGAAFSEKNGFYVNMEGRVQFAEQAVLPPGDAREDWKIIRGLSEVLGHKLPYETYDDVYKSVDGFLTQHKNTNCSRATDTLKDTYEPLAFQYEVGADTKDTYLTNPICRASATLAKRAADSAQPIKPKRHS